jgi:hypothetical protein
MDDVSIVGKGAGSEPRFLGESPMPPKPLAMAFDRQCQMIPIEQQVK